MTNTEKRQQALLIRASQVLAMQRDEINTLRGIATRYSDDLTPGSGAVLEARYNRLLEQIGDQLTENFARSDEASGLMGWLDRIDAWLQNGNRALDRLLAELEKENGKGKRL